MLQGGSRYDADMVPDDEQIACFYETACDLLGASGLDQYEISNFARLGYRSRHNQKYWQREPYIGFGLDAHSMLRTSSARDLRFANSADLVRYLGPWNAAADRSASPLSVLPHPLPSPQLLTEEEAFEETLFLGLRRKRRSLVFGSSPPCARCLSD